MQMYCNKTQQNCPNMLMNYTILKIKIRFLPSHKSTNQSTWIRSKKPSNK